jgi:hypothetical protein
MKEPKVKLAVSLSPNVVDQLRAVVADGGSRSVSAYVEHAVRAQLTAEAEFDSMVADMLAASGGPATDAERAEAARLLGIDAA